MYEPESFSSQQASDPLTPGQVLADIAALRPDLRPAVAANPSAYPGLLEWLAGLGEPAVDAALRARATAPTAPAAPTAPPTAPAAPAAPAAPVSPSGYGQPAGGQALSGGFTAPGGDGSPTGGRSTPSGPGGYPPSGPGGYPPSGPGSYPGPATAYGYQPAGPPAPGTRSSSNKVLWIVLGVVLGVIVLGVVGLVVVRGLVASIVPDIPGSSTSTGDSYGDDPALDGLWDACEAGDGQACDDLYMDSPLGSEYEEFADTCGHRTDGGTYCVDELGGATDPGGAETSSGGAYGDDPALDALWDACAAGDGQSCDDLYFDSPIGSEYEQFADTCGQRTFGGSFCVDELR